MKSDQEIEQKNELLNKKRQNLSSKNNSEYQSKENKKKKINDNKKQKKLRIERISPPLEKSITALYPYKTKIFTGIGNKVQLWEKIHIIKEFKGNEDDPNDLIKQIMTFENILLFITKKGDLFIYEIHSGELISRKKY